MTPLEQLVKVYGKIVEDFTVDFLLENIDSKAYDLVLLEWAYHGANGRAFGRWYSPKHKTLLIFASKGNTPSDVTNWAGKLEVIYNNMYGEPSKSYGSRLWLFRNLEPDVCGVRLAEKRYHLLDLR